MSSAAKTQIVNYTPDCKDGVLLLMSSVQYKNLIWHWQFEENPCQLSLKSFVIKSGDEIVGFNGAMPVKVNYESKPIDAIWSCDFYLHSNFRYKGLGKLVKAKQFDSNSVTMALGLSDVAAHVWKQKGCIPNEDILGLRRFEKIGSFKSFIWYFLQKFEFIKGSSTRINGGNCKYIVNDSLGKKGDVDGLWEKVGHSYEKIVVRDYDYLHWRYEKHPLASYQYVHVFRNNELEAIGIFRRHENNVRFVDMVAHATDIESRSALVASWLKLHCGSDIYNCMTTDKLLQKCLLAYGFCKTRNKQWFFVKSFFPRNVSPEKNWFIMSGDSDGEFLEAAASGFALEKSKINIKVEESNDTLDLINAREEWTDLLAGSLVNKLFLSWEWQCTWWETWAEALNLKLILLKAYDGNTLVGIAPLYIDNVRLRGGIKINRIQFIGNAWHRQGTVRTEYLEFITSKGLSNDVCAAFIEHISGKKDWDEFVICDLQKNTDTYKQITKQQKNGDWFIDIAEQDYGMNIGVLGSFDNYVKDLGRNTRLKLFNRRKYLERFDEVKHTSASVDEVSQYLSILNGFHQRRWGKDCFDRKSLDFHKELLNRLSAQQYYNLECMNIGGNVVSILYNLTMGNTVYNIQSGFDESFDKKLSLGTLHMGYAIEDAFHDQRIIGFDMLAGNGKSEFYKKKYKGKPVEFVTLRITKLRFLNLWYVFINVVPESVKDFIHKIQQFFQ